MHPKDGCVRTHAKLPRKERFKHRELGTPKHMWIAEAMLQLCYHKVASNVRLKIYELSTPKDCRQAENECLKQMLRHPKNPGSRELLTPANLQPINSDSLYANPHLLFPSPPQCAQFPSRSLLRVLFSSSTLSLLPPTSYSLRPSPPIGRQSQPA